MPQQFDVAVIGAGPGGYVAAIRAAQLGFSTVCIDAWKNAKGKPSLGGTCLNVGCIPSKALLESSENFERVLHKFDDHGISIKGGEKNVVLDVPKMLARKDKIVDTFTTGITLLFKKNKVASMHGIGRFAGLLPGGGCTLEVVGDAGTERIDAKHVIIATGSVPRSLPGLSIDNRLICDNVGALSFPEVPRRLGVIGAGVIGLEMGSVWRRLGSEVTILEAMPTFLAACDEHVSKEAYRQFTGPLGLKILNGAKVHTVEPVGSIVKVEYEDKAGNRVRAEFDRLIVSIGRTPNTAGLNPDAIGLRIDTRGYVEVDERCRTNVPNVWAIGDVVRGPMLAHKSSEEGVAVAESIAGQHGHVNLDTVPWVIYTSPEIAWVGRTEQDLKQAGVDYRSGQFPFIASGRARALGETAGFCKMLADAKTDRILGVHIIGPFASELIGEAVVAMEFGASSEDIARIVHAHPSLSEALHEAALGVDKRTLNL
ncbi:MAG: dihydrolipoyl dehydrogenase [Burkholderiales bacterium]|jgi:dihydrolipoamide dehydrogenase|nr:dihydrolipoyl dehydrogenase [Burkholderiales bacterium]